MIAILAADFNQFAEAIPGIFALTLFVVCCIAGWRYCRRRGARKPLVAAFVPVIAFAVLLLPAIYAGKCTEHAVRLWKVRSFAREEQLPILHEDRTTLVIGLPNRKGGEVTMTQIVSKVYPRPSASLERIGWDTATLPVFVFLTSVLGLPRGTRRERLLNAETHAESAPPRSDDPAQPV